jgi:hypothetical protein
MYSPVAQRSQKPFHHMMKSCMHHYMLWCCIDMRLVDEPLENPMFNRGAWRLIKAATELGCDPYLVGARFQVGPRNLPAANSG